MVPYFFQNRRIFENFKALSENFRTLLSVKTKVLNFMGKSLKLDPLLYRCHDAPALDPSMLTTNGTYFRILGASSSLMQNPFYAYHLHCGSLFV